MADFGEEFKDKVCLISGSSSGIGRQCIELFSSFGAKVVINGRNEEKCLKVKEECLQLSPNKYEPLVFVGDLSDLKEIEKLFQLIEQNFNRLDILVNNAAMGGGQAEESVEDFEEYFRVNTRSVYAMCIRAKPLLEKSRGVIVNISSINGLKPFPNTSYCVSKAALDMMTRCLAQNWGPKGIRVNGINPAQIDTPIWQEAATGFTKERLDRMWAAVDRKYPIRRRGYPDDIARAVVFLCSDKWSGFITGLNLKVDGGFLDSLQLVLE